ncbi:MAG: carboxymuconolactone decarboxylase family protein [Planctomycetes bacterium]|nr:carboxymuconolactone decarboxylase family protein [Planctomycetota bacterium]
MQRIRSIDPRHAQGRAKELLTAVEKAFGVIPNAAKVMANSPAVLDSFLALSTAMSGVAIGGKLHHQVKLTTSETNTCSYCTSILTAMGPAAGLSAGELIAGRSAKAADARTDAALKFAKVVLESKGKVADDDLRAVRQAGFGDAEIVEIVASVVVGCFTNFLNNVADTELDIPKAEPIASGSTSACRTTACAAH